MIMQIHQVSIFQTVINNNKEFQPSGTFQSDQS